MGSGLFSFSFSSFPCPLNSFPPPSRWNLLGPCPVLTRTASSSFSPSRFLGQRRRDERRRRRAVCNVYDVRGKGKVPKGCNVKVFSSFLTVPPPSEEEEENTLLCLRPALGGSCISGQWPRNRRGFFHPHSREGEARQGDGSFFPSSFLPWVRRTYGGGGREKKREN